MFATSEALASWWSPYVCSLGSQNYIHEAKPFASLVLERLLVKTLRRNHLFTNLRTLLSGKIQDIILR